MMNGSSRLVSPPIQRATVSRQALTGLDRVGCGCRAQREWYRGRGPSVSHWGTGLFL